MIKKLSFSIHSFMKITKKYSTSKLYIPYNQTSDTYVVIEPYVDFKNNSQNIKILKNNIVLRGLDIDIDKICSKWSIFLNVRDELVNLNVEKQKITEQLKKMKKENENEIIILKENKAKVMTKLKVLRDQISTLETEIVIPSLGVPNNLHSKSPLTDVKVLFQHSGKITLNNKSGLHHLDIGKELECLDYINSVILYLKNEAAVCEQALLAYFNQSLEALDFIPICNSDLIKSVVIEGCGVPIDNADQTFILSEKDMHLLGGASLESFCAFLTKQSVGGNKLPLRLYTSGRSYKPSTSNNGLFSAAQTNAVEFFIGSMDDCKAEEQFDLMMTIYQKLYEDIGLDYRIVYSPVSALQNWESLRAEVQLYSISCKDHIVVGSLSLSGDYISKRLRIQWSGKDKQNFLHIVSGRIVNTNVLLGCLLEQNINEFTVPECISKYMIV